MTRRRKKERPEQPMNKYRPTAIDLSAPQICMSRHVRCQIMCTIGALSPETGGILLGPIGSNDITDFYFDATAICSYGTYTPDYVTLRRKMKEVWMPSGIDMKGFVHSHPGGLDRLSQGDLDYIRRLLQKNPDMSVFAAPIVIPEAFRLRAIVVLADQPSIQRPTNLQLF
jgi:proteasome lid subunit RPN8/RPN11